MTQSNFIRCSSNLKLKHQGYSKRDCKVQIQAKVTTKAT